MEQTPVARLDHGPGGLVGAHYPEPLDLALRKLFTHGDSGLLRLVRSEPARQDPRGLVDVWRVGPAIVEHALRDPLVSVVLDKRIEKGHDGVLGHDRAPGLAAFQFANQQGRVGPCLGHTVGAIQDQLRQELDPRLRQTPALGRAPRAPYVRNAAVAQDRAQLAAVRRARSSQHAQRFVDHTSSHAHAPPRESWLSAASSASSSASQTRGPRKLNPGASGKASVWLMAAILNA